MSTLEWQAVPNFKYNFPQTANATVPNVEHYTKAWKAEFKSGSRTVPIMIAFATRRASGQDRCRVVVFIKNAPTVEFVGADDFDKSGRLASVIKGKDGKHIRCTEDLPLEYATMPVDFYSNLITGPYTAGSVAVVADKDDLTVMARHAFIRAQWKGWLA